MRLHAETQNERPGMMARSASRDRPIASEQRESAIRRYFSDALASYLSLYVRPEDVVVEINPLSKGLGERFTNYRAIPGVQALKTSAEPTPDYVLLNGALHYERDVQEMLNALHESLHGSERVLFVYYSMLWKPLVWLASKMGFRARTPEQNWIAHEDLENFC